MIVLDTSGLYAALDRSQDRYAEARAVLEDDGGPYILSPFVLAELDDMIARKSIASELRVLVDVGIGVYQLEPISSSDVAMAAGIVDRYRDLRIGLTDASIVVLAARAGTHRILTLDERHFRALRPLSGGHFRILPADSG